jgi:hypothetical protein
MTQTLWLARRAVLAILLMVTFYVLALVITGVLLWIPYAEWAYLDRLDIRIGLACYVTAATLVIAVFPRRDRFVPPGPELSEVGHRRLFAEIRSVAEVTKQDMPADVYLINEVNAFVTNRGGTMGFGGRRVMGIGLSLLQGLTISEFKSVLAHEFGHYAAGDVRLGPWIYKTRAAIARTMESLSESWLAWIFDAYGNAPPTDPSVYAKLGSSLPGGGTRGTEERVMMACAIVASAVATVLLAAGATLEYEPGSPMILRLRGVTMDPFSEVPRIIKGELPLAEWQAQCHAMGVAGRTLGPQQPIAN